MESQYNYSNEVVSVQGGNKSLDNYVRDTVGAHYNMALAVIVALVIVIVVLLWKREGFSANHTMRQQTVGLSGSENYMMERAESGVDRKQSAFAQTVQTDTQGSFTYDPLAKPGEKGSLGYQILHSDDFNCDMRKEPKDDAWDWMIDVAGSDQGDLRGKANTSGYAVEGMQAKKKSDSELSYRLGH